MFIYWILASYLLQLVSVGFFVYTIIYIGVSDEKRLPFLIGSLMGVVLFGFARKKLRQSKYNR